VKSAGKNFGTKIVWYAALPAQAALAQAADKESLRMSGRLPLLPSHHLASNEGIEELKLNIREL
jgi:hypothetical protein